MTNLEIIERLYAAVAHNDTAAAAGFFAPEIEWIQAPGGLRQVGVDVVLREVLTKFRTAWNEWQVVVQQYIQSGDTVVVLGEFRGIHHDRGQPLVSPFAHVYDLRDGRIVRVRQYADTAQIRDTLEAREDLAERGAYVPPAS
jgi:ketosteroid isomerase-like protein